VQAEDRADVGVPEATLLDHHLRAAVLADRGRLLGGLEDQRDAARDALAHSREQLGHAHEDGRVRVVPAGVHHAAVEAVPLRAHGALEGDVDLFGDGKRVHVGAQRHGRSGLAALEDADHAGMRDLLAHDVEAERAQVLGDDLRRAQFPVAELGILVEVAPPGDDLRLEATRGGIDRGVEGEYGVGSIHTANSTPLTYT
jgi:hypothetical protein